MTQNPFEGFQQGLMTGATLGGRMRQNQQRQQIGGMLGNKDYAGAAQAAYGFGDIGTGAALSQIDQQQQARERGTQITGALAQSDYAGAMSFASSPEELQAITEFRENATEQEREAAVLQATNLASVIEAVSSLPPEQQLAAAQQYAPQFGVDPAKITAQTLQQLPALRVQALGLKDYLTYQQKERDAQRPIIGNGFISLPPGSSVPQGIGGGQSLGATLPPGWTVERPNQAPSAPAAGGAERNQPVGVSFRDTSHARQSIEQAIPGVRFTSGTRDAATNKRVGGVPTSNHLRGRAWDLVPPPGMTMAQLEQKARAMGLRALNEGDHIHVSW